MSIYRDNHGNKNYRVSFCAYFDILGFKDKIESGDQTYFETYMKVLETELVDIEDNFDLSGKQGFKTFELKIFTDNFVLGHPWIDEYGEAELGNIFTVLAQLQFDFLLSDIFVRGAISLSELYMDENIVVGPAIIEAYKLESEKAIYPRIILSPLVIEAVQKHMSWYKYKSYSPQYKQYLIDIDNNIFLNYLYILIDNEYSLAYILDKLKSHKKVVIMNIKKHKDNYKLFEKFAWVGRYHNYFIEKFLKLNERDKRLVRIPSGDLNKIIKKIAF